MKEKSLKSPTLGDVAKVAGVSPATVTRVVRNYPVVNQAVRERVLTTIKELNYSKAKSPGKKESFNKTVGLIIPDISNPFFPLLIKGIENTAKVQGYHIILCDSENDRSIEEKHIQDFLDRGISGLICTPVTGNSPFYQHLIKEKNPVVFLDRIIPLRGLNYVTSDNSEGTYQAAKYLLNLGHREILYIGGSKNCYPENERFAGFKKAMEEEDIRLNNDLIIYGEYDFDKAYEGVTAFLAQPPGFTAILATNDMMAFGVKKALEEKNIRIPEDISLMGYDDIPFSAFIGLTTIAQPAYEMGKNAMLLLIDLINGRIKPPRAIVLRTSIIIRNSCKRR